MGKVACCNWNHFVAILFRRRILFQRSLSTFIFSTIATLFFAFLAVVAQYLISTLVKETVEPIGFQSFKHDTPDLVLVVDPEFNSTETVKEYVRLLERMFKADTGMDPVIHWFADRGSLNEWMYNNSRDKTGPTYIDVGFWLRNVTETKADIPVFYNGSSGLLDNPEEQLLFASVIATKLKFQHVLGTDFTWSVTVLFERTLDRVFGQIGPMLITGSLISMIPLFISQPIIDTMGEVRSYMQSCTMSLVSYWTATWLLDFLIWTVTVTFVWCIFLACQIQAFLDNMFNTWYAFVMCGPSFIIFVYCFSFCFDTAESASRNAFIIVCLLLIIPVVVDIVRQKPNPVWLEWVYALFPFAIIQRILMAILTNMGFMYQKLPFYFTDSHPQAFTIMQFCGIIEWSIILVIIEHVRIRIREGTAKRTYGKYTDVFREIRERHQITEEAIEMERRVDESHDFAVRVSHVSRLFFNTANEPVCAVNDVSLGVKENSVFGFLGANGAGKTTLIKMITSLLPPSTGTIEIDGQDISKHHDPTILAICPQFNNHLCNEMTPAEHFKMYCLLHQLDKDEGKEKSERLIHELGLDSFRDQPLRELSGGDVRKLAIALSFLGHAHIILLDEPTASLDPVARHHVHEMILNYKGQKTFMLCTHLLSEAEFLCDMISIMIKGCVYTCGTAQYLTQKFGTDFKIDVMLDNELAETGAKCDAFFASQLPTAVQSIVRPKARIYSIPARDHPLPELFAIMQRGQEGDNGFSYFTCSSSSLERVFMELVHMSENDDIVFAKRD